MAKVDEYEVAEVRTDSGEIRDKGNYAVDPTHRDFSDRKDIADGVTDAYDAIRLADAFAQEYGLSLILRPGTYRVATDITIASPVRVVDGVAIQPENGVTVTFGGSVQAAHHQWVDLSQGGSIAFSSAEKTSLSVAWFGAVGDDSTDCTAPITNAVTVVKQLSAPNTEIELVWPAGTYQVSSVSFVGADRLINRALGNVIIKGVDSSSADSIVDINGGQVTRTGDIRFGEGFSVQTGVTGYDYGVDMSYVIDSRIHLSVSGAFDVAAVGLNYAWENQGYIKATNSKESTSVYVFYCGNDSVNANDFKYRLNGAGSSYTIGLSASGTANRWNGDINSCKTGLDMSRARGNVWVAPYFEAVTDCVVTGTGIYLATNNVFVGGLYEVITNGTAFKLGEGSGSYGTRIISPYFTPLSGGSNRTAFDFGSNAYLVDIDSPHANTGGGGSIDTWYTGTYQGATGGFPAFGVKSAQWISFPPTQVSSSDVNTLDDYEEGTWTPAVTFATAGDLSVTYTQQTGTYTKVGDQVTLHGFVVTSAFTHTTAAGALRITGLPFAVQNVLGNQAFSTFLGQGITKANYTQFGFLAVVGNSYLESYASGSGQNVASVTAADMPTGGSVILYFSISYKADT